MCRISYVLLYFCWLLPACATFEGSSGVETQYFSLGMTINEYAPQSNPLSHISHAERLREIRDSWRFGLQAYRAVRKSTRAREALAAQRYDNPTNYPSVSCASFMDHVSRYGVTERMIRRQSDRVFTLQLGAFGDERNLIRFLKQFEDPDRHSWWEGTDTYEKTEKQFYFYYGSDLDYKYDMLYLTRKSHHTCVHYGIYATIADARRDAAAFERRYRIKPFVLNAELDTILVNALHWGEVPGLYKREL